MGATGSTLGIASLRSVGTREIQVSSGTQRCAPPKSGLVGGEIGSRDSQLPHAEAGRTGIHLQQFRGTLGAFYDTASLFEHRNDVITLDRLE